MRLRPKRMKLNGGRVRPNHRLVTDTIASTMDETVTYNAWMAAFQRIYDSPGLLSGMQCPNCGSRCLNLVFVVRRKGDDRGWVAFWCSHCMSGVAFDSTEIRSGMRVLVSGSEPRSVSEVIPNYRLIPPSPADVAEE